jgi:hypothetical protein
MPNTEEGKVVSLILMASALSSPMQKQCSVIQPQEKEKNHVK